jgi:hypothetical protein
LNSPDDFGKYDIDPMPLSPVRDLRAGVFLLGDVVDGAHQAPIARLARYCAVLETVHRAIHCSRDSRA